MLRARFPLSRVLVSRVVLLCLDLAFHGVPRFPFYRRRESAGYRGGKGEEPEREEGFQGCRVLLLRHVGPTDPVDVNRDGSMSWPYSSLVPYAGVICRSWRSTLS